MFLNYPYNNKKYLTSKLYEDPAHPTQEPYCEYKRLLGRISFDKRFDFALAKNEKGTIINFRKEFWQTIKKPFRVFFFTEGEYVFLSLQDPVLLPQSKIYRRRLQYAGRDSNSCKATIPRQIAKNHRGIMYGNTVFLHRMNGYKSMMYACFFGRTESKTSPH